MINLPQTCYLPKSDFFSVYFFLSLWVSKAQSKKYAQMQYSGFRKTRFSLTSKKLHKSTKNYPGSVSRGLKWHLKWPLFLCCLVCISGSASSLSLTSPYPLLLYFFVLGFKNCLWFFYQGLCGKLTAYLSCELCYSTITPKHMIIWYLKVACK